MANTAVIPVKAIRSGDQATGDVIALGEFRSGDKIDSIYVSGNTQYMQVANVVSTYQTISVERAALANTNAYIASVQSDVDANEATELSHLANTNSYIATKLDSSSYTTADVQSKAALANTNSRISSTETDISALQSNVNQKLGAGASVTLSGDVSGSATFSSNSMTITTTIADDSHNHTISNVDGLQTALDTKATWSALTSTNTAIRALTTANANEIGDVWSGLIATNTSIRSITSGHTSDISSLWSALTSTNTSIRSAISSEVSSLVDSAPSTLDTLNELAAALGDDANFATTVATNLGQKLGATASITLTGDVTGSGSFSSNAVSIALTDTNLANTNSYIATKLDSSSYTAADVLTKIKTVDGSGSGLDADTLDGQHASAFADQGFVFAMSIALG